MKLKQKLAIKYIRARLNILSLVSTEKAAKKAFDLFCTPLQRSKKKGSPVFDTGEKLSFRMEGHMVRGHRWLPDHQPGAKDGGVLAATGQSEAQRGDEVHPMPEKVLIVHGFESTSRNFGEYVRALLDKGYEVLAFDAPAHGTSGGKRITLPLYIKTIQAIVDRYGPVQAFLGHSFGGLALSLYLESRDHDPSTRLVLIAPACEMTTAVNSFFRLLQLNEDVRSAFEDLAFETGGRPFDYYSVRRAMNQITATVLWVHDEEDKITPFRDVQPVRDDRHTHIRFLITRGLGHRKIYRDPEILRQVVAFL